MKLIKRFHIVLEDVYHQDLKHGAEVNMIVGFPARSPARHVVQRADELVCVSDADAVARSGLKRAP